MNDDHGTREVTPEDRRRAIVHELMTSRSNVRITPGMVRGLREQRRRGWWRGIRQGFRSLRL